MSPINLIKNKMMRRHKNFAFYVGIGLIIFIAFSYLASPEIASARIIRFYYDNLQEEDGHVTPLMWWWGNIFAPYFFVWAFLKIALGLLLLPLAFFEVQWGQKLLFAGWLDLTVMWPGLLLWTVGFWSVHTSIKNNPEEDKPEEDK